MQQFYKKWRQYLSISSHTWFPPYSHIFNSSVCSVLLMTQVLYLTQINRTLISFFSSSEGLDQNCSRNRNQSWRKTRRKTGWNCPRCHCYCLQTRMRSPRSRCCLRKSHWKSWTNHCCCWNWRRTWKKTACAISATSHHSSPNRCLFLTCATDQLSRQCEKNPTKNTEISLFPGLNHNISDT